VDIGAHEFNPLSPASPCLFLGCTASSTQQCGVASSLTIVASQAAGAAMTVAWSINGVMMRQDVIPAGDPPTITNLSLILTLPLGTNRVEVVAIDGLSNTVSCSTVIAVIDTTPPVLECPNRIVLAISDAGTAVFFKPRVTDLCSDDVQAVCIPPSGSSFPVGTSSVMCRAEDGSGNSTECSFTVTVVAALECPEDIIVQFTEQAGAKVSFTLPTLNPPSAPVNVVCIPPSDSLFPVGTNMVVCSLTDDSGNSNQCAFTVVVLGVRGIKLDVLNEMFALKAAMGTGPPAKFDRAILHLTRLRTTNFWTDEAHLKTRSGAAVFRAGASTVNMLRSLLSEQNEQLPPAVLHLWTVRLVHADRILAIVELQDAIRAGATQRQLEGAIRNLIRGDAAAQAQRYQAAVTYYQKAWQPAARRTDILTR
jgi:hypothetical protein